MELMHEDRLFKEFDHFLESKESYSPEFSTYTELNLFTDIQYLKILESQLEKCENENSKALDCAYSSTKFVSKTYTILTPAYLKRRQTQILETIENVHQVITDYLDNASQYAGRIDTNCWFEWWEEYMESLTDEEHKHITEQLGEAIMIRPNKSLEQFALERQNKQSKQFQKNYVTSEIA